MKLGLVASCFLDKSWEEVCKFAGALNLEAIEPGSGAFEEKVHCNPSVLLKNKKALKTFISTAEKYKLDINCFDCTGNFLHPQKEISKEHISDLEDTIELANRIGVKIIKCLAGCPGAYEDAIYPNWITFPWPPYFGKAINWQWNEKIIPFWKKMVKKAKKAGIKFGFELHPGDAVYNTKTFLKLRKEIDEDEIVCTLDISHLFYQGIDPIACLRSLSGYIVNIHAKDCKIDNSIKNITGIIDWEDFNNINERSWNYRVVGYGHGAEFWSDFIATLKMIGYKGFINIEHEDPLISPEDGVKKAVSFLNNILIYDK